MDDLHEEANLQLGKRLASLFVVVLSEAQEDLEGMTMEGHSDATRAAIGEGLGDFKEGARRELTIGGHPAVQYEIEGKVDGIKLGYLHTTVDDGVYYHQILAWTLKSQFAAKKGELLKVVESFESEAEMDAPPEEAR